jgi:hypothetical protein
MTLQLWQTESLKTEEHLVNIRRDKYQEKEHQLWQKQ